jgi:hypothetical protein
LVGADSIQPTGCRCSVEFGGDPVWWLLAVPACDHSLVLVPVREYRIVLGEHEVQPVGECRLSSESLFRRLGVVSRGGGGPG